MDVLIIIWIISCIPLHFWMDAKLFKQEINFHLRKLIEYIIFFSCFTFLHAVTYVVAKLMGWPVLRF